MEVYQSVVRREFLKANAVLLAAAPALLCRAGGASGQSDEEHEDEEKELTPLEDLMLEHGFVRHLMLVCREGQRRLEANEALPPNLFVEVFSLMRSLIENHHEPAEEDFVFPRLVQAGALVGVVGVLKEQHRVSRRMTDKILSLSGKENLEKEDLRKELCRQLSELIRMYEHHAVCEDTMVFPEFRRITSAKEYEEIGGKMEQREHEQLGEQGMRDAAKRIAEFEQALGIDGVVQFTPSV